MSNDWRARAKEWIAATHAAGETIEVIDLLREALDALAAAEKCAEVLCTFAGVLPHECGDAEHCSSEICAQCRAIDACEPYMKGRKP